MKRTDSKKREREKIATRPQLILSVEQSIKIFHANAVCLFAIQHGPYDLQTEFQTKYRNIQLMHANDAHTNSHVHMIFNGRTILPLFRARALCVLISCGDGAATFTHLKITLFLALARCTGRVVVVVVAFIGIILLLLLVSFCIRNYFQWVCIWKTLFLFVQFQWIEKKKKIHILIDTFKYLLFNMVVVHGVMYRERAKKRKKYK